MRRILFLIRSRFFLHHHLLTAAYCCVWGEQRQRGTSCAFTTIRSSTATSLHQQQSRFLSQQPRRPSRQQRRFYYQPSSSTLQPHLASFPRVGRSRSSGNCWMFAAGSCCGCAAGATALMMAAAPLHSTTTMKTQAEGKEDNDNDDYENNKNDPSSSFDVREMWKKQFSSPKDFWDKIRYATTGNDDDDQEGDSNMDESGSGGGKKKNGTNNKSQEEEEDGTTTLFSKITTLISDNKEQEGNNATTTRRSNSSQSAASSSSSSTTNDEEEQESSSFLSKVASVVFTDSNNNGTNTNTTTTDDDEFSSSFQRLSGSLLSVVKGGPSTTKQQQTISDIVSSVRDRSNLGAVEDQMPSWTDIFSTLEQYRDMLDATISKYMGGIELSRITATAAFYYLEQQDEIKNPSWKRRVHRFCRGIDMNEMEELNRAKELAQLSYADTLEEVQDMMHKVNHELVYCQINSEPGKPAHFLAVEKDQPGFFEANTLKVILVVRGTKTVADALTDLLCDTVEYQGGKAHSFILGSGKYIVNKHHDLLLELLESSGRSRIELEIIGHSLGAGAASIAGIEFNNMNDPRIHAQVVGFGCPALVSEDLAVETSDYITTVINDDDVVPRLSGATVANALLDVLELDWLPYAKNDVQLALDNLKQSQPLIFSDTIVENIKETIEPLMESQLKETILSEPSERLDVELFPPGKCVHLYRDGVGFSGCYVPNTFFSEIDVSRKMVNDHLFHSGYTKTLLEIERQRTGDHHFRFDQVE